MGYVPTRIVGALATKPDFQRSCLISFSPFAVVFCFFKRAWFFFSNRFFFPRHIEYKKVSNGGDMVDVLTKSKYIIDQI